MPLYHEAEELRARARERERESGAKEYSVRRDDVVVCRLKNHFLFFFVS